MAAADDPITLALSEAIRARDLAAVERLLGQGANADAIVAGADSNGWDETQFPLITLAARAGDANIVAALIDAGAGVDARWRFNEYKWPDGYQGVEVMGDAIEEAAGRGHTEVVALLLEREATSRAGALASAALGGHVSTATLLLDHGVDAGRDTNAPLCAAVRNNHMEVVRLLVEHGALVDRPRPDDEFGPPFVAAIVLGRVPIAAYLLEHGAKPPSRVVLEAATPTWAREQVTATLAALGLPLRRKRAATKQRKA